MNAKRAAAMIAIKADDKALKGDLSRAKKTLRMFGKDISKGMGKIWGGGKGAVMAGAGALGLGAIFETRSLVDFEKQLLMLRVSAGKSTEWMSQMRDGIHRLSKATGISREDILGGAGTWVERTGDIENAAKMMELLGKTAQASGSSTADLAVVAAALKESGVAIKDMEAAFSGIIAQSDSGAVGLKDMAGHLAELLPMMAQFGGGKGISGLRDAGAAMQVIMKGAGSAGAAAAQFKGLMSALGNPQVVKKLAAIDVNVFDKTGKMRNYIDLMEELAGSEKLTAQNMGDIFGDQQARTAVLTTRAQIAALRDLRKAGDDVSQVQKRFDTVMASDVMKLESTINRLKVAAIERGQQALSGAVQAVDELAGKNNWERNPFSAGLNERVVGKDMLPTSRGMFDVASAGFMDKFGGGWLGITGGGAAAADAIVGRQVSERANLEAAAKRQDMIGMAVRNALGYETSRDEIQRHSSREEQVRAAVTAAGSSSYGSRAAGEAYLRDQGVSQSERATAQEIASALAKELRSAPLKVEVKLDSSAVAKTTDNAAIHRGGR
jgi:TP901 family phage tail tape measure protein